MGMWFTCIETVSWASQLFRAEEGCTDCQEGQTLVAFSPLGPGLRSNETRWFSESDLKPVA